MSESVTDPAAPAPTPPAGANPGYWVYVPPSAAPFQQPHAHWRQGPRERTTLGYRGLALSISSPLLFFIWVVIEAATSNSRLYDLAWVVALCCLAGAVVGFMWSCKGMSSRFINRGPGIAGLIVGIFGLLFLTFESVINVLGVL